MRSRSPAQFLKNNGGSTTVEFVVVFLAFIAIMFFVVEVTLYMFFLASLEKAAEAGVRIAAVSQPVVSIDLTNDRSNNSVRYGTRCSASTCRSWNGRPPGCGPDRAPCGGAAFNQILSQMRRFNGQIGPENVGITYSYTGIGFAGGPAAPMVTATISCVPFQAGILGLLLGNSGGGNDGDGCPGMRALPPRAASMTGENLGRAL
jgi:TadE-like protein